LREWEKDKQPRVCAWHAGESLPGNMRHRRVKDKKGQKPEREEGSIPWGGTVCAWEPELAWGGSAYKGQRLQEPAPLGCRCTKPIDRGDFRISIRRASSPVPHEIGNRVNRIVV